MPPTPKEEWHEFLRFSPATQEYVAYWIMCLHQSCLPDKCTCVQRAMASGRQRATDIANGMPDMDRKTSRIVWDRAFAIHTLTHPESIYQGSMTPPWAANADTNGCSCFTRAYDEVINNQAMPVYGEPDLLEDYREREI